MKAPAGTVAAALTTLASFPAHALDIQRAETRYHDGVYELQLELVLDAPLPEVERLLRDYTVFPQLDPRVLEAKVLERLSEGELLLYSRLRACIAFFCRTVERVEHVEEGPYQLIAATLPERSDVEFGLTQAQWSTAGPHATRVSYRTQIDPKFWIPRLIGRRAMLETLRDATVDLFTEVERVAQQSAGATPAQ